MQGDEQLKSLVERLATDNPCTSSYEGLDDGCFFCDGFIIHERGIRASRHEPDCVWVEARRLMGHPIEPHEIKPLKTPITSRRVVRLHDPLIGW